MPEHCDIFFYDFIFFFPPNFFKDFLQWLDNWARATKWSAVFNGVLSFAGNFKLYGKIVYLVGRAFKGRFLTWWKLWYNYNNVAGLTNYENKEILEEVESAIN